MSGRANTIIEQRQQATTVSGEKSRDGLAYGIAAYTVWGFMPIYFHLLAHVPSWRILCHRIFWSAVFLALVVTLRKEWRQIWPILRNRRNLGFLTLGAVLIAMNWMIFIYAVGNREILQASLGYFITPLLSIALGMIFLHEKLRRWQWVAVGIALLAVLNLSLRGHRFPWIAIALACSFGCYGLVRKKLNINSLHGLMVETAVLLPIAAGVLLTVPAGANSISTRILLSMAGVVTAIPLLMFGVALRQLRMATIGFLQYISPTLQFLLAVAAYHEPIDRAKLVSFALCWLGITVYVADSLLSRTSPTIPNEPE